MQRLSAKHETPKSIDPAVCMDVSPKIGFFWDGGKRRKDMKMMHNEKCNLKKCAQTITTSPSQSRFQAHEYFCYAKGYRSMVNLLQTCF